MHVVAKLAYLTKFRHIESMFIDLMSLANFTQMCRSEIRLARIVKRHLIRYRLEVTVYLQGCLAAKQCSASSLDFRYLSPYIKLKLTELGIQLYQ